MLGNSLMRLVFVDLVVVLEENKIDRHIAVKGTKLVNELLLVDILKNINAVDKLKQCTEIGSLDSSELVECCVSVEYRLKYALIIKVLRNSYLESHVSLLAAAEVCLAEYEKYSTKDDKEYNSKADIADTAGNTCCHCKE